MYSYLILCLALYCSDGNNAHDIVCRTSSGQIVYRLRDTLSDRSVCLGLRKTLRKLITDVACVKIREDQNIGPCLPHRFREPWMRQRWER